MEGVCSNCGGSVGFECGEAWASHENWCKTDSICPACHDRKIKPKCAFCAGLGHVAQERKAEFNRVRFIKAFERADVLRGEDKRSGHTRRLRILIGTTKK